LFVVSPTLAITGPGVDSPFSTSFVRLPFIAWFCGVVVPRHPLLKPYRFGLSLAVYQAELIVGNKDACRAICIEQPTVPKIEDGDEI
jgi:hypothetical protein